MKTSRFLMKAGEDGKNVEIMLYDEIGEGFFGGIGAKRFAEQLNEHPDAETINVRINSPGGSTADGAAMHNSLSRHPGRVIVDVEGMALSAASVVAMAGDEINMAENAMMMIHDPVGFTMGDIEAHEATTRALRGVKAGIVKTYAARTGKGEDDISTMMAAETWFTADDAVEAGFADKVTAAKSVEMSADPTRYGYHRVPETLNKQPPTVAEESVMDIETLQKDHPDLFKQITDAGFTEGHTAASEEATDRMQGLKESFSDRPAFIIAQFIKGHDVARAKADLSDIMGRELLEVEQENAKLKKKVAAQESEGLGVGDIRLSGTETVDEPTPDTAMTDRDFEMQIGRDWEADKDGCQKRFKIQSVYAGMRRDARRHAMTA